MIGAANASVLPVPVSRARHHVVALERDRNHRALHRARALEAQRRESRPRAAGRSPSSRTPPAAHRRRPFPTADRAAASPAATKTIWMGRGGRHGRHRHPAGAGLAGAMERNVNSSGFRFALTGAESDDAALRIVGRDADRDPVAGTTLMRNRRIRPLNCARTSCPASTCTR